MAFERIVVESYQHGTHSFVMLPSVLHEEGKGPLMLLSQKSLRTRPKSH
jgi:hypothetical protein